MVPSNLLAQVIPDTSIASWLGLLQKHVHLVPDVTQVPQFLFLDVLFSLPHLSLLFFQYLLCPFMRSLCTNFSSWKPEKFFYSSLSFSVLQLVTK